MSSTARSSLISVKVESSDCNSSQLLAISSVSLFASDDAEAEFVLAPLAAVPSAAELFRRELSTLFADELGAALKAAPQSVHCHLPLNFMKTTFSEPQDVHFILHLVHYLIRFVFAGTLRKVVPAFVKNLLCSLPNTGLLIFLH